MKGKGAPQHVRKHTWLKLEGVYSNIAEYLLQLAEVYIACSTGNVGHS